MFFVSSSSFLFIARIRAYASSLHEETNHVVVIVAWVGWCRGDMGRSAAMTWQKWRGRSLFDCALEPMNMYRLRVALPIPRSFSRLQPHIPPKTQNPFFFVFLFFVISIPCVGFVPWEHIPVPPYPMPRNCVGAMLVHYPPLPSLRWHSNGIAEVLCCYCRTPRLAGVFPALYPLNLSTFLCFPASSVFPFFFFFFYYIKTPRVKLKKGI